MIRPRRFCWRLDRAGQPAGTNHGPLVQTNEGNLLSCCRRTCRAVLVVYTQVRPYRGRDRSR